MNYRQTVRATVETVVPNFVGIAAASTAVSLTALPVLATAPLGSVPAVLGGLWTACLLFGVALVGTFRFAAEAADRDAAVSALPHLVAAAKQPRVGLELGAITFVVLLTALTAGLAVDSRPAIALGIALFLLAGWYLVVALAVPELGAGTPLGPSLRAGVVRFARSPAAAGFFLLLSVVCTALAGVTIVTLALFLPGTLALLAAHVASGVAGRAEVSDSEADEES